MLVVLDRHQRRAGTSLFFLPLLVRLRLPDLVGINELMSMASRPQAGSITPMGLQLYLIRSLAWLERCLRSILE